MGNVKTLRGQGISERVTNPNGSSEYVQPPAGAVCRGPASAGSRGTLRMNGVGEKKRERETRLEVCSSLAESGKSLFFYHSFYILS